MKMQQHINNTSYICTVSTLLELRRLQYIFFWTWHEMTRLNQSSTSPTFTADSIIVTMYVWLPSLVSYTGIGSSNRLSADSQHVNSDWSLLFTWCCALRDDRSLPPPTDEIPQFTAHKVKQSAAICSMHPISHDSECLVVIMRCVSELGCRVGAWFHRNA